MSQQKPDDTIEIDLDLDELDATSAETKATYQEIKDYVLKEFGNLCQTGKIIVTIFSVSAYDSVVGSLFVNCRRFGVWRKNCSYPTGR